MVLPLLLLFEAVVSDSGDVYHGRKNQLTVAALRKEAEVVIDGVLGEPVWAQAGVLTGFSQFSPVDGVPAADSTEILVWYSPSAIYFGIRAFETHGAVHATLADRDRIFADDYVQILLGTFNDRRQATVVMVNPLGVQADGALIETGRTGGGGLLAGGTNVREPVDLRPDIVFQSQGRVTDRGYEVEVRVPFKSLRYQPGAVQVWGINVVRQVQHSGYEDSWAPASRANASFLGQSGTLTGLSDLRRGVVLDLNPELTTQVLGAPEGSGWGYRDPDPELGGNVRWGITNNLTLSGTANPDFSQVESDAGQLNFDPRQDIFFAEKRPFFIDGIELFSTPNNLVYTRRIIQPVAAVKLTGKALGGDVGLLTAVDDQQGSFTGDDHPVYNLLRVQRDIFNRSRLGLVYTDRVDGGNYNRVAGADTRLVLGRIYSAQFQAANSWTQFNGFTTHAPLWQARLSRTGRTLGFRYFINGIHENFRARSGFIPRPGIVNANVIHSLTGSGGGPLIERFVGDIVLDGTWKYRDFVDGRASQDRKLHLNTNAFLRGGWGGGVSLLVESFGYDPDLYARYAVEVPRSDGSGVDIAPFTGTPRIPNLDYAIRFNTPDFKHFSGNLFALWGHDENFFEWASGNIVILNLDVSWRPTDQLRLNATYQHQQVDRRTDGSTVDVQKLPRLKLEYQLSRPVFIRLIGEYFTQKTDSLRDDSRTNQPILICEPGLTNCERTTADRNKRLRGDLLFSYQPNPGTVLFAGYGRTLREPNPQNDARLRPTDDGFFVKMSYLFRM